MMMTGLSDFPLWQDEANAALLGKCILKHGIPKVILGDNYISCLPADVRFDHVWRLWGWLPLYLNAFMAFIKGTSTFWARFPYALMGALFPLIVFQSFKKFSGCKLTAACLSLFITSSYVLLLHFRQCQYYAPAIIISFLMFIFYFKADLAGFKKHTLFVVLSFILFQVNFLSWLLLLLSLSIATTLTYFISWRKNFLPMLLAGLVNLPAFIYFRIPEISNMHSSGKKVSFQNFYEGWLDLLDKLFYPFMNLKIFLVIVICALVFLLIRKQFTKLKEIIFCLLFITAYSLALNYLAKITYYRYFISLIPVIAFTFFLSVFYLFSELRLYKVLLFCIALLTIFNIHTNGLNHESLTSSYIKSLFHDAEDVNEVIINHLNKHAVKGETLLTNYGSFPIIYYTELNVGGGVSGYRYKDVKHIYPKEPIISPDWLIIRSDWKKGRSYLEKILKNGDYHEKRFKIKDLPWGNRPSPYFHYMFTQTGEPVLKIYRKNKTA